MDNVLEIQYVIELYTEMVFAVGEDFMCVRMLQVHILGHNILNLVYSTGWE